jgi:hypothetical protein
MAADAICRLLFLSLSVPAALACELKYDPVSAPHFYREKGWFVPGTVDEGVQATDGYYGLVGVGGAPGVKGVVTVIRVHTS